ncbi:DNA polymerase III subunit delta [Penaeicola halotolerans]|uniref:DNA polymerase III subunit delta n=1 Tax=Penaeicola halotolerans TaxID=2793196 RepID=UPI001CF886F5|nr:DNA polymerase III subunit delta [Penaeicola halotolerans]
MPSTPQDVLKDLKAGKYAPVYFLQGDEPYYIDLISNYIEKHALQEHEKGFNQIIMYGKESPMSTILNNAKRFPMMADRQVVIVKEAKEIPDLNKEQGQTLLEAYLKNPMPSTILVFAHKYKTLDGRKAVAKIIDKTAILVNSPKLYDNKIPQWIEDYLKEKSYKADPRAVQMLADAIGNNLERLANEIEKILINFEGPIEITPEHVQQFVGISKEYSVFELQKALSFKDAFKANQIIQYFSQNPKANPIIPVISMCFNLFTKLLLIHHASDKSERNIANLLGVNPFFVKEYMVAARNYPIHQVVDKIGFIKEADLRSKGVDSGDMEPSEVLKELVYKLLH